MNKQFQFYCFVQYYADANRRLFACECECVDICVKNNDIEFIFNQIDGKEHEISF